MAQPFDYTIASPQAAFQASYAFGQQIAAQKAAQQQAQQQAMEAQQARQAMQMVYDNPTPENISKFYMAYPAYKEQFEAARQPLTDAAKADDLDFSSRTLALLTNGATEEASALMQARVTALRNTPGREEEAARTEAVAQMIAKEPQAGKALLGMKMAAIDPKLYETMFGKTEKPYEAVAGVGIFLKRDIEKAIAAGDDNATVPVRPEGAIAVNPKTGQKLIVKNGKLVPMGGGSGNATGGFPAAGGAR